jgi:hypothetical protein
MKFVTSKPEVFHYYLGYRSIVAISKHVVEGLYDVLIAQVAESLNGKNVKAESDKKENK